jgi:hypothetical protein
MTTKKKLAERLPMKMSELVTSIAKIDIAPKQKYLVLEVCVCVCVCARALTRACVHVVCEMPSFEESCHALCVCLYVTCECEGIRCAAPTKMTRILKHLTSVTSSGELWLPRFKCALAATLSVQA